jgi:PAS domain S-box-containing protein
MLWSVRPNGVVDFLNRRWLDYSGLSLKTAIQAPNSTVHPDDLPKVLEGWLARMAAGQLFEAEMRLRRADGEYRWFLVQTSPLRDGDGKILKWFGSGVEIEERKRAEKQLAVAHQHLEMLSRQRLKVREHQRRHLAHERYDEIRQALAAAKINLQAALDESDLTNPQRIRETTAILERLLGQMQTRRAAIDNYSERIDDMIGLLDELSCRQREILQLIAEGKNTKEVAANLQISVKTVEAHRLRLMERLRIHDVPGLVRFAIRTGLVSAEV